MSAGVGRGAFVDVQAFAGGIQFKPRFTLAIEGPVNVDAIAAAPASSLRAFLTVAWLWSWKAAVVVVIISTVVVIIAAVIASVVSTVA